MKRVLAIAVVFALVAGAAFAEWTIGGGFGYKAEIVGSSYDVDNGSAKPDEIKTSIGNISANFDVGFNSEKFGGRFRMYAANTGPWWGGSPFGYAWWKPVDKFRVQIGHNPDGDFGGAQITGWGYNASAQDSVAIDNDSDGGTYGHLFKSARKDGFYGGFSGVGLTLSYSPVSMVDINVVIPFGDGHADKAGKIAYQTYRLVHAQVKYTIDGIGVARLSWQGRSNTLAYSSAGSMYASFLLNAIEGLQVDFGVGFDLPYENEAGKVTFNTVNGTNGDASGFQAGLGVAFSKGISGFKFRFGMDLNPGVLEDGNDDFTRLGVGLLPYVKLEKIRVYLSMGLGTILPVPNSTYYGNNGGVNHPSNGDPRKPGVDWYVNPYVQIPAGGLTFWAGFKLGGSYNEYIYNTGTTDSKGNSTASTYRGESTLNWAVPIGITVGF